MQLLICGDIHGNLPALEVLLKAESNNYDSFVSHGDVVNYAPWSNECVDCLATLKNKVLLKGNHEENYLSGSYPGKNIIAKTFFDFCYPRFERLELISEFGFSYNINNIVIQHTIDNLYIYPDTPVDSIMKDKTNDFIIGHSHYQFISKANNGNTIYNTGSIGQNRVNLNIINYVMYDTKRGVIKLKHLKYNARFVLNEMKNRNYPEICLQYYQNKIHARK